ncbi:heat shock protein 30 [Rhodofomes roseus]|uniref:Heat shock protein 30 n=1 Tax=Rhodofomes roseus TaxID=34475 RepID=A0ABQ8KJH9_9APHY|nr:heat shock protein 30 [Rhodofomes roseus]KAH9838298.1 heat shock protein 30 [Rhodofomes roseus]
MAGNQAVSMNPPNAQENLSTHGSDWLWAVFSIMALSTLLVAGATLMRPRGTRLFHQLAVIVLTTASIAYFSMASDLGATPIAAEFRGGGTRQIWYVRYIQWFINFPILLLVMLLATGLPLSDIVTTIFMSLVIVVSGLVGALVHSTYKWGYYTFGLVSLFYIWYVLLWHAPASSFAAGGVVRRGYYLAAGYFSFMLITYPIAWACAEGGNVITVTSEMIWYGILDILTGPVFLAFFLWELRGVDYEAFGFRSGRYVDNNATAVRGEKAPMMAPAPMVAPQAAPAAAPGPAAASAPEQTV